MKLGLMLVKCYKCFACFVKLNVINVNCVTKRNPNKLHTKPAHTALLNEADRN